MKLKRYENVRQLVHLEVVLPPSSPLGNQKKKDAQTDNWLLYSKVSIVNSFL